MKNIINLKRAFFALFFILVIFLFIFIRPLQITFDNGLKKIIICWYWDKGNIEFINSVTHSKVKIYFNMKNYFSNFQMITDEKTENYYTSGYYDINQKLKKNIKKELFLCSKVGIKLMLSDYIFLIKNSCLRVKILWNPKIFF